MRQQDDLTASLSPHSIRHAYATLSLDAGAPLRDLQDAMGHADPRTTRRYDRSRGNLDHSPGPLLAGYIGQAPDPPASLRARSLAAGLLTTVYRKSNAGGKTFPS